MRSHSMAFAFNAPFHDLKPYTPAIDIWSIGCIFGEMLMGKPLFPGKNVVHQLDLITDLLGTPSTEAIARIKNEKARRYLSSMRRKSPVPLSHRIPHADPLALKLLERLIAFDPRDRPSAEEALADPYFYGLANVEDEPSTHHISKFEFEFERRKLTKDDARELIYREILEYHPQMLREYLGGMDHTHFMYPSGIEQFKQQFHQLEDRIGKAVRSTPLIRRYASLPRERVCAPIDEDNDENSTVVRRTCLPSPTKDNHESESVNARIVDLPNCRSRPCCSARCMLRSSSISASTCIEVKGGSCEVELSKQNRNGINGFSENVAALYA